MSAETGSVCSGLLNGGVEIRHHLTFIGAPVVPRGQRRNGGLWRIKEARTVVAYDRTARGHPA